MDSTQNIRSVRFFLQKVVSKKNRHLKIDKVKQVQNVDETQTIMSEFANLKRSKFRTFETQMEGRVGEVLVLHA